VNLQDLQPAHQIRVSQHHLAIEPAHAQQRWIRDLRAIRGGMMMTGFALSCGGGPRNRRLVRRFRARALERIEQASDTRPPPRRHVPEPRQDEKTQAPPEGREQGNGDPASSSHVSSKLADFAATSSPMAS
jgi:hypothetical protein